MIARLLVLLLALPPLFLGAHRPALAADDRASAKAAYDEGMRHYNLGDYATAREKFRAAYLAFADPAFLFNIAQASRMMGDWDEALRAYRAYLRAKPGASNREEVEVFIEEAERQVEKRRSPTPPTEALPPSEPAREAPVQAPPATTAAPTAVAPPPPPPVQKRRPAWVWGLVGGGAALAVGAAVAVSLIVVLPKDAPTPTDVAGAATVRFP